MPEENKKIPLEDQPKIKVFNRREAPLHHMSPEGTVYKVSGGSIGDIPEEIANLWKDHFPTLVELGDLAGVSADAAKKAMDDKQKELDAEKAKSADLTAQLAGLQALVEQATQDKKKK